MEDHTAKYCSMDSTGKKQRGRGRGGRAGSGRGDRRPQCGTKCPYDATGPCQKRPWWRLPRRRGGRVGRGGFSIYGAPQGSGNSANYFSHECVEPE